jgi:hypothetical protein
MATPHHFRDYRGLVQRRLQGAEDLEHVHDIEPARWSSTSVPTEQLFVDAALLEILDADKQDAVALEEIRAFRTSYTKKFPNGDGVITPAQIEDAALKDAAARIVKDAGGAPDVSGDAGVSEAALDAWKTRLVEMRAWEAEAAAPDKRPLGDDTAAAAAAVGALEAKLEQFFAQCDLVGLEKAAHARLEETVESLQKSACWRGISGTACSKSP